MGGGQSRWVTVKLGDIFKIRTGKLPAKAAVDNGGYPFFTASSNKDFTTDTYAFDGEHILVAKDGEYAGFTRYFNGKFNASNHCYVLDNISNIDTMYVYHYMKCIADRINDLAHGGAIPGLNTGAISSIEILAPSTINEQQRIASVLSTFNSLVERIDTEISNILSQKQAIMDKIFS